MRIGIVGVSGYGGSELLRLCVQHPSFEVVYAAGESSAGQAIAHRFPTLAGHPAGKLKIEPFVPERIAGMDLLFASLPTGKSREPLARVPEGIKIVDVGGDHRFVEGWTYGLTEFAGQRAKIVGANRVANPGCYPGAVLLALAPLVGEGLVEPEGIVVDAKSGVTGTGRGGARDFGYAETNEDLFGYGLEGHSHVPELVSALSELAGRRVSIAFTPHLIPMTRGILATCYARPRGTLNAARLYEAARACYDGEAFVRVVPLNQGTWSAYQVGQCLEFCVPLLCGERSDRARRRAGGDRQPRQGRIRPGGAEREPHDRAGRSGGSNRATGMDLIGNNQPAKLHVERRPVGVTPEGRDLRRVVVRHRCACRRTI